MRPKLSVIVLNWNRPNLTVKCVERVLAQRYKSMEIIIVDNGSHDDSVHALNRKFMHVKNLRIFRNHENLGFGGGFNSGMPYANGEYVVLLPNDTLVEDGSLDKMVCYLDNNPKCGAVLPLFYVGDKLPKLTTVNPLICFDEANRIPYEENIVAFGEFSFVIFRNNIGMPFSELEDFELNNNGNEFYFCMLVQFLGYEIKFVTDAIVRNLDTSCMTPEEYGSIVAEIGEEINRIYTILCFYERRTLLKLFPLVFVRAIGKIVSKPYMAKSYMYILRHIPYIAKQRALIRDKKRVSDEAILARMTYKFFFGETNFGKVVGKIANGILRVYSRIVGLKTMEFYSGFSK